MTYMHKQLNPHHIRARIQEVSSGGGGPGHTDKKDDFFLQMGPMFYFKKNYTFQKFQGAKSNIFQGISNFFVEGLQSVETCRPCFIANAHALLVYALNCLSMSSKCTYVPNVLERLL